MTRCISIHSYKDLTKLCDHSASLIRLSHTDLVYLHQHTSIYVTPATDCVHWDSRVYDQIIPVPDIVFITDSSSQYTLNEDWLIQAVLIPQVSDHRSYNRAHYRDPSALRLWIYHHRIQHPKGHRCLRMSRQLNVLHIPDPVVKVLLQAFRSHSYHAKQAITNATKIFHKMLYTGQLVLPGPQGLCTALPEEYTSVSLQISPTGTITEGPGIDCYRMDLAVLLRIWPNALANRWVFLKKGIVYLPITALYKHLYSLLQDHLSYLYQSPALQNLISHILRQDPSTLSTVDHKIHSIIQADSSITTKYNTVTSNIIARAPPCVSRLFTPHQPWKNSIRYLLSRILVEMSYLTGVNPEYLALPIIDYLQTHRSDIVREFIQNIRLPYKSSRSCATYKNTNDINSISCPYYGDAKQCLSHRRLLHPIHTHMSIATIWLASEPMHVDPPLVPLPVTLPEYPRHSLVSSKPPHPMSQNMPSDVDDFP